MWGDHFYINFGITNIGVGLDMKRIDFVGVSIISLLFTSSLFLSIHIEADPDPEKDGNDNSLIFSRSLNLTENSIWHRNLAIADINNNSYPEIITSPVYLHYTSPFNSSYPYKDVILFIQVNKNNSFNIDFEKYPEYGSLYGINVEVDNDQDFLCEGTTQPLFHSPSKIYVNEDHDFTTYPIYFQTDPDEPQEIEYIKATAIGDLNADGRPDIIYSAYFDGMRTVINEGEFYFNETGWDNGLPRFGGFKNDPVYQSLFENKIYDVNNDGWLDMCTGMGIGGEICNINNGHPMVCYIWTSDGSGNWTSYSKGFPKYRYGTNIDIADIDNDGDLDFGLLTPDEFYILENTGMNDWKILNETFPDRIKSFSFEDIDLDGYQDLVYYKTDSFNKTHKRNELWIGYGDGNWNWDLQKQTTIISGYPGEMYLKDIDLDGDKDLINTFSYSDDPDNTNPQEFYTGGIYCVFNDLNNSPSLRFTETLTNPHVRSGSVYRLEWSGKDAWRYADTTQSFNLSISYTGENGTYHRLKSNIPMWWTELIIPDTPSENAYLKIEWNGYDATSGPFVIHDKEDRTRLIKPSFPKDGDYLIGGEEMDIALNTSVSLGPTDVDIIIHHDNGSYDLGSHPMVWRPFHGRYLIT